MIPAAILATAGAALVTAMVTDGWEGVRKKVAQWFGRGKQNDTDRALTELDQSRAALTAATGAELDRARTEQEIIWRTRMEDLASPGRSSGRRTARAGPRAAGAASNRRRPHRAARDRVR